MKPEQQRIKIAEACGYKYSESCGWFDKDGETYYLGNEDIVSPQIPEYTSDLNAMHEAMKTLSPKMGIEFCSHLDDMDILGDWDMLTATAAQRAEAFLRTLNLWEE